MTIPMWLGVFGVLALVGLIGFLMYFIKDSRLRVDLGLQANVLLLDCTLLFIALVAIGAAIFLYLDWQEQLNYFMNR